MATLSKFSDSFLPSGTFTCFPFFSVFSSMVVSSMPGRVRRYDRSVVLVGGGRMDPGLAVRLFGLSAGPVGIPPTGLTTFSDLVSIKS